MMKTKTVKRYRIKRLVSMILTACIMLTLLPVPPASAAPSYTLTIVNGTTTSSNEIDNLPVGVTQLTVEAGKGLRIQADQAPDGKVFHRWETQDGVNITSPSNAYTWIRMPANNATVTVNYKIDPEIDTELKRIQANIGYVQTDLTPAYEKATRNYTLNTSSTNHIAFYFQVIADGQSVEATANGEALEVEPALNGFQTNPKFFSQEKTKFVFTITSKDRTKTGQYTVTVNRGTHNIYPVNVNGGSSNLTSGPLGEIVNIYADPPAVGMEFDKWVTYDDNVSITAPTLMNTTFVMPENPVTVTATYKSALFAAQPGDAQGATGKDIPFDWQIKDVSAAVTFAGLQVKNGQSWENIATGSEDFTSPGLKEYSLTSDIAGTKTYRLKYRIGSTDIYSDEFNLTWIDSEIRSIGISPTTASVQKGRSRQFESRVIATGIYEDTVNWFLFGQSSEGTTLDNHGNLTVAPDETGKKLTIMAQSTVDDKKIAMADVNVVNAAVTEYTLTVINGEGAYVVSNKYAEGDMVNLKAPIKQDQEFMGWTSPDDDIHEDLVDDDDWSFYMPDKNMVMVANYTNIGQTNQERLTGKVTMTGEAKLWEEVTATVSECNGEDLRYRWITYGSDYSGLGNPLVGGTTSFEIDDPADASYILICEITSSSHYGSIIGIAGQIPKLTGPPAPEALGTVNATSEIATDGKITGTDTDMEYADNIYFTDAIACTGEEIQGLSQGVYRVRYKETYTKDAGDYATIVVGSGQTDQTVYGDINGDETINIVDLVLVAKAIAGTEEFDEDQVLAADVNGDGVVNIVDYVLIAKRIAGTITEFPIEQTQ